jgi:hypothetical protein
MKLLDPRRVRFPSWLLTAASALVLMGAGTAALAAERAGGRVELHGFLAGTMTGRTTGVEPPGGEGGDLVLGEERLRLEVAGSTESGEAFLLAKADLFHDAIANEVAVDLREAYAGIALGTVAAHLGRQILTWGVGDLFFVNDVFPKDWESFFSGRPMEYLKLGVDGVRLRLSASAVNAEAVAIPFFTPDRLPPAERFFLYDPFAGVPAQREEKPDPDYAAPELALRLFRQLAGFDLSVYAYRGFWRTPAARLDDPTSPTVVTRFYPRLSVYGASAQTNLLAGVVSLEGGFYDSREDRDGTNPLVHNSEWRVLAGYQAQPRDELMVGLQAYSAAMTDYAAYRDSLPRGNPREDEVRLVTSLRLTQWLDYQTWKLSLFLAYSPTDGDYFLQPEASYKVTDSLSLTCGMNLFGGSTATTFFGQLDKNDNVYASLRFDL